MVDKLKYIDKAGVARLVIMGLAWGNQLLTMLGKPVIDFNEHTVSIVVTSGITAITQLVAWYYNNPTSKENTDATKVMRAEKKK